MSQAGDAIEDFDLVIIGTGSGNSLIGPEMDGWRIAIVERDPVFGGTCLNRGCIPTKMLVYTADVAESARHAGRYGVHATVDGADWPAIRDRVFGRIDPIATGGRDYRLGLENVTVFTGEGRFVGERTVEVGGSRIRGAQVVIAAGARPHLPEGVPGLDPTMGPTVPFHTSDTIMRIDALPEHLVVVGGGFIACELAHMFGALGSRVTIIQRSDVLLTAEDRQIAETFTELARRRFEVIASAHLDHVAHGNGGIEVRIDVAGQQRAVVGDVLLVATGRTPNGDRLDAHLAGVDVRGSAVVVDDAGRTSAPGVWALGDVNGRHQLKHMANGEARVVRHNLSHPDDLRHFDHRPAPHGVFTFPQIGAVGLTEAAARAQHGDAVDVVTHPYSGAAYGWALEDCDGYVKLVGDRRNRTLLGAHMIGYHAATAVQLLIQGMHLGATVDELAVGQIWIHPALPEVIEQALLKLIEAFDAR